MDDRLSAPEQALAVATAGPEVVALSGLAFLAHAHLTARTLINWAYGHPYYPRELGYGA